MKKQYLAWGLAISLSIGTIFGNSGISWAFENTNQDKTANVEKEESSLWDELGLLTPSNAVELMTSSNAATENTTNKPTETTGLKKQFTTEDGIIVEIDSQDVILPENTQIQVKKVDLGSEITDSVRSSMQENQKELEQIYAYDISFWNDGEEFEPSDGVKVTFKLPDTMTGEQVDESEIFHVKDGEDVAEFVPKTVEGDQEISCQSVGFSVYGIAVAQAEEWIPIYTAGDLQNIQNDLAGNYKLMNDIDMSDFSWKPIGEDTKQKLRGFTGTLDGQNFSISNLSLKAGKSYRDSNLNIGYGIFTELLGTVKNLKITDSVFEVDDDHISNNAISSIDVGILAASLTGGSVENCVAQNCEIDLRTTLEIPAMNVGTFAGKTSGTSFIKNCKADNSTIKGSTYSRLTLGGIAGSAYEISDSIFAGSVNVVSSGNFSSASYVGGISGITRNQMKNCVNSGNITATASSQIIAGGITGRASGMALPVSMCVNYEAVYTDSRLDRGVAGGIVGELYSSFVENCYNAGNVKVVTGYAGGIIGYDNQTTRSISRCYNIGSVETESNDKKSYAGDIIGYTQNGVSAVTGTDGKVALLLRAVDKKCYYINTAVGNKNERMDNVVKVTLSEMEEQSTFEEFDFDNVWVMGEETYPYPVLQFQNDVPQQPDNPDIPDSDEQLGWVKFKNGKVGYYILENNQCQLLKSGIYKLNYTDQNGVIFNGRWKFNENGYVMTGMHDGLYYCEDEDGLYPYGMCIPDKGLDGILKEEYNQSHIRPSTVLSRYSFISTYMDDMNYFSYILSAKIDDGWMKLTGDAFLRLAKQLGFIDIDDINVEYLMTESNNRKILAKVLDVKFAVEGEKIDDSIELWTDPKVVAKAWDEVKDERGYIKFIIEKVSDALKNEEKYSDSFNELAKEVKKKESNGEDAEEILGIVAAKNYELFDTIMEQVNGWSDALRDHSEKISYLNELEASIDKIDSGKIKNIQNLKNAVSELRNNYEERIKLQVFDTCFAVIEQGNSWNEVLTGEKRPLTGWDFKENTKYNMSKVVADVIKDLGEGSLPLLKGLSKAITTIQTIDGRPEAVNTIAQTQMLYTVAYDVLREKEEKLLIDGDSESLADYLNAFEFMRCITILRYQNMKKVYDSIYSRDGLKQFKVDFLQKEIDKLQRITPLNYFEDEFASLTFAGSWDESGEKYYYATDGDERFYIENRWAYIDGKRYYFDQNGRVLVGTQKITDETGEGEYYFSTGDGSEHNRDHRGAMQTGPIEINGKEYYYDSNSGVNRGRKVINSRIEIGPKDYRYYGPDGAYDREKSGFSEVTDTDPNHKFYDKGGIRYATNCPVDIIIYDENDNMVGKIVNDQVQNVTDDEIDVYVDSAGQKIVGVPQSGKYKLEIIARAAGTMDYSVAEFASDGSGLIGKTDYRAVTLNQADHFYGITESMFYNGEEHNSYRLLKENTEIELAEYQDTLTSYLINASAEGHGTVEGSKAAIRGDFAKLTAKPDSGYRFVGWYDKDGNCVSKELEFRFRVLEEQNFTAKFTVRGASDSGSDSSDDSDDTSYIPKRGVTGKWIKNEKGWWYQRIDGTWPHDEWCELEYLGRKEWYYFDKNGYVVTGWLKWNGCYFYLNPISDGWFGRMETGWKKIDGKWYYLEPVSGQNKGHLFVNTVTPDGYKVDSNGAWMK